VRSSAVDIIVVDSVAALVPRAEIEGEIGAVQGAPALPQRMLCLCCALLRCVELHRLSDIECSIRHEELPHM